MSVDQLIEMIRPFADLWAPWMDEVDTVTVQVRSKDLRNLRNAIPVPTRSERWQHLEMDASVITRTAQMFSVAVEQVATFYNTYACKARNPELFWPWYTNQMQFAKSGMLPFEPSPPHEVFPQLLNEPDFYRWT